MNITREKAKELLPIIKAFAEGKTIQYRNSPICNWEDVVSDGNYPFRNPSNYRIKPEPKYRPFQSQEECWNEMHKHPDFGWIMAKDKKELVQIGSVLTSMLNNVMIALSIDERHKFNSSYYFKNYTFTDGAPFGVEEE